MPHKSHGLEKWIYDICCIYECVYMYTCICRNMFHIEFTLYQMDSNGVAACRLLERLSNTTRFASLSLHRGENPEKNTNWQSMQQTVPSNDLSIVQCHTRNSVWKYPLTASYGQQVRLFTGILLESTTFWSEASVSGTQKRGYCRAIAVTPACFVPLRRYELCTVDIHGINLARRAQPWWSLSGWNSSPCGKTTAIAHGQSLRTAATKECQSRIGKRKQATTGRYPIWLMEFGGIMRLLHFYPCVFCRAIAASATWSQGVSVNLVKSKASSHWGKMVGLAASCFRFVALWFLVSWQNQPMTLSVLLSCASHDETYWNPIGT